MPIYEYRCPRCNLKFERLRRISEASKGGSCPRCHNSAERILSTFSAVSRGESGVTSPVGGSSCSSCSSASCSSCGP